MVGHSVISIMCSGFCARMVGSVDKTEQDLDLLCDFVSDVDEFDKRFFSSGIQESGYLGKYLLPRLLSQHSFVMLKSILKIQPTWFSQAFMHSSVVSFIRDTASSQGNEMHVSLECQEILGPLLPNIAAELEQWCRTLEARQFMSEAMKLDPLLLGRLFSFDYADNPIVIIEALMELSPQALLLGCEFWGDERASKACADATVYFSAQICASLNERPAEDSDHVLPPMPGSLVMQLGHILGLRSSHDLLLVKTLMVFGALKTRLVPVAAAICLSMLCDGALSRNENATTDDKWRWTSKHDRQVLDCVVAVVRDKSVGSVHTKREICSLALRLFSFRDPPLNCVESFKDLEYQLIALERDSISPVTHQQGRHSSDLLLFKAVGLVARQARDFMKDISRSPNAIEGDRNDFYDQSMTRVYYDTQQFFSVDLLKLLSSTGESSSTESLTAISEVILNWLTSEAFKARRTSLPSSLPVSNILTMMELGSSCLAELAGQGTASSIISRSVDEFKAKISQCNSSPDHSAQQPDLSIVRRLNARGYGMNAARRAVIMTNNQGYTEALAYAVGHFMDEDFDSPFYVLRDGSARVDRQLIAATSGFLQSAQHRFLEKKRTRLATPSKSTRSKTTLPFVSKLPSPSPQESLSFRDGDKSTPTNGSPLSSVEGSLSDCRAVKRQIQLGSKRTQKLPPDDRQRLAMEGKRLLDAARARNKRVIAPPTSITTSRRAPS